MKTLQRRTNRTPKKGEFVGLRLTANELTRLNKVTASGLFLSRSHAVRAFILDGYETAQALNPSNTVIG